MQFTVMCMYYWVIFSQVLCFIYVVFHMPFTIIIFTIIVIKFSITPVKDCKDIRTYILTKVVQYVLNQKNKLNKK